MTTAVGKTGMTDNPKFGNPVGVVAMAAKLDKISPLQSY